MTIRRQYSLPNCTLILEGLSDPNAQVGGQLDPRPLMTILVNAQCRFPSQEYLLEGGRDFFESLVRVVSRYAQECLSQVSHPKLDGNKPAMVQLEKLEGKHLHRLTQLATAEALPVTSGVSMASGISDQKEPGESLQIDLTTVQLFDLVEAIDQFLADGRTLPDIQVGIEPVSKRYRQAEIPVTQRATPAAVGMTSLVLAAVALFFVPVPEVLEPKPTTTEETSSGEQTTKPSPTSSPTTELEQALQSEITDPTEVSFLQRSLYKKVNQAWQDRGELYQNLSYRVSVGQDGAIIGYRPINNTSVDADEETPLPELLYTPTADNQESIASFRVVFNQAGILQVSPWLGYQGKPGLGPQMTDPEVISDLKQQLRETLRDRWEGSKMAQEDLVYRVGVTEEGIIADYEPRNQAGWDYVAETPLEELINPEAAGIGSEGLVPKEPLAQFRVVFWPGG
ncbi:MAG: DUF4335 domain-containing protein, partial [Symploca sp. SIO2E6]|nr:DUF4335 domain-containing protein [Symploca sp. SIO2E6]